MGIFDFLKRKSKGTIPQSPEEEVGSIEMPPYLKTKVHGQTATLVDMLIELNKEKHFKSADEALETLFGCLEHLRTDGDRMTLDISLRSLGYSVNRCFFSGHLDVDCLKNALTHNNYYAGVEKVYGDYVIDKTVKLVEIMNEFRRYTNLEDIRNDLWTVFSSYPQYFSFGAPIGENISPELISGFNTVFRFFRKTVKDYWKEFSPKGVLDNALFRDFMLECHEKAVAKYGIEEVICMNYKRHPCDGANEYLPKEGWVGPVYKKVNDQRKYVKLCGGGVDFQMHPTYFEGSLIMKILEVDRKYVNSFIVSVAHGDFDDRYDEEVFNYSIPISDYSLPIYNMRTGEKKVFESQKDKAKFIIKMKLGMGECLRCPLPPYLEREHLKQELMDLAESEEERKQIKEEFSWYWH